MTASCPELGGISARAPCEKEALELLRRRIDEHDLRRALAEHAGRAAPPPAPTPVGPRPSIDHCISTLVHDVLHRRAAN